MGVSVYQSKSKSVKVKSGKITTTGFNLADIWKVTPPGQLISSIDTLIKSIKTGNIFGEEALAIQKEAGTSQSVAAVKTLMDVGSWFGIKTSEKQQSDVAAKLQDPFQLYAKMGIGTINSGTYAEAPVNIPKGKVACPLTSCATGYHGKTTKILATHTKQQKAIDNPVIYASAGSMVSQSNRSASAKKTAAEKVSVKTGDEIVQAGVKSLSESIPSVKISVPLPTKEMTSFERAQFQAYSTKAGDVFDFEGKQFINVGTGIANYTKELEAGLKNPVLKSDIIGKGFATEASLSKMNDAEFATYAGTIAANQLPYEYKIGSWRNWQ